MRQASFVRYHKNLGERVTTTQRKEVIVMPGDPIDEAIRKAEEKQEKQREAEKQKSAEPSKPTTPTPSPTPSPKP